MAHKNTPTPSGFLPPASGQLPSGAGAFYNREEISHPYNFSPNGEPRNAADEIASAMWEESK